MNLLLALDGPARYNGRYIDADTAAANGYHEDEWPTGERVYMHGVANEEPFDFGFEWVDV